MDTELESSQRNHPVYAPYQIQCPRCGTYHPKLEISYQNPRTGEDKSAKGLHGCLISIVAYFAIILVVFALVGVVDLPLLIMGVSIGGPLAGMLYILSYLFMPVPFAGAIIAIPLYRAWRRNRLRKTHITEWHFVCSYCEMRWTVRQEPTALPPGRKHRWLISVVLVLILTGLIVDVLQATHAGELSKTPLVEQDMYGNYECWVITKNDPNVTVLLSNPNSNTVYRHCMTFMEQAQGGAYYSAPSPPLVNGLRIQCEGYSADKTYWEVEAPHSYLITDTMCFDLEQIIPPKQG